MGGGEWNPNHRPNGIIHQYGKMVENKFDYGIAVGEAVASGECERGVAICGSGIGISIAANKVKGVRCALCSEPYSARLSRSHNDANVLAMGARLIGLEMGKAIVDAWFDAEFEGGRHSGRIDKISNYES